MMPVRRGVSADLVPEYGISAVLGEPLAPLHLPQEDRIERIIRGRKVSLLDTYSARGEDPQLLAFYEDRV